MAEAQLKEAEALQQKYAAEAAVQEAEARGPLREETIRLSYADPEEVAETLQGILGIPKLSEPAARRSRRRTADDRRRRRRSPSRRSRSCTGRQQSPARPPAHGRRRSRRTCVAKGLAIRAHKPDPHALPAPLRGRSRAHQEADPESFDIPLPQVKIEARMEILDRNALEQIGIQWGGGAVGRAGSLALVGQGFQAGEQPRPDRRPRSRASCCRTARSLLDPTAVQLGTRRLHGHAEPERARSAASCPSARPPACPSAATSSTCRSARCRTRARCRRAGLAFGIIAQKFNVNLALQALAEQGKTRTLARPEIVTVENNKAIMSLGEEIPYATVSSAGTQIQFKEALLKLEVTPTVIREGDINKIKMLVIVENNSRGTVVNLGNSGNPPAINKRKAETQVLDPGRRAPRHRRRGDVDRLEHRAQGADPRRHAGPRLALQAEGSVRAGPRARGLRDAERPPGSRRHAIPAPAPSRGSPRRGRAARRRQHAVLSWLAT